MSPVTFPRRVDGVLSPWLPAPAVFRTVLRVLCMFCLLWIVLMTEAYAANVSLAWNPSTSADVSGYRIHYGLTSGGYTSTVDAGNQTTATVPNLTPGQTYYFAATAYNTQNIQSAFSNEVRHTVPLSAPVASFNASPTSGTAPLTVNFTDTSAGTITTWAWTFGDGTISSVRHPSHAYTAVGAYTVSLTVTGSDGANTKTHTNLITVSPPTNGRGLVAAYGFEDGSGTTLTDVSGANHHGTINGATWTTAGHAGQALSFDGVSNAVTVANPGTLNLGTTDFTIEAWVKRNALNGKQQHIISKCSASVWETGCKEFYLNTRNQLTFGSFATGNTVSLALTDTAWHHVAVSFADSSNTLQIYVDGTLRTTATRALETDGAAHVVTLGNMRGNNAYSGLLDDMRIYNRVLTAAEIQADMQTPVTPPAAAPVANFTGTPTTGTAPLAVTFTNTTTGNATSWLWDLGNGVTSTLQTPPSQTYAAGVYTVKLTATGPGSSHTAIKTNYITTSRPPDRTGLVAAYSFENGSGTTLTDVSGVGNHGTIRGATWTTQGHFGRALIFNGTSDWVTIADAPSLDLTIGMTLEAWVFPTGVLSGWDTVLLKQRPGHLCYALYANTNTNRPAAQIIGSGIDTRGPTALPLNTWSHLAATYDGAMLRLYVNGQLASSRAVTGLLPTSTEPLRIGGNSVWNEYFAGRIDEVRIYNRALTVDAIQADMQTAVSPTLAALEANLTEAPPVLTFPHHQTTATTTPDRARTTTKTDASSLTSTLFEVGEVEGTHEWQTVTFRQPFRTPIIVANVLSQHDSVPTTAQVRAVTSTDFEVRVAAWNSTNRPTGVETISYLVLERGRHIIAGAEVEAGSLQINVTPSFAPVSFSRPFPVAPVVLMAVVNPPEPTMMSTQMRSITTTSVQARLQEQTQPAHSHAAATLTYIAWEPSVGTLDGLHFEVQRTTRRMTTAFGTIPFTSPFMNLPVFLAAIQTAYGPSATAERWENRNFFGVDLQLPAGPSMDAAMPQGTTVIGYVAFASSDGAGDTDRDGLTNESELNQYDTDPAVADTDADGIPDGAEVAYWGANWQEDNDGDGLINLLDPDADGDGVVDGAESNGGVHLPEPRRQP